MRIRYFVVDDQGQLQRVPQAAIEGLWNGDRTAASLGCTVPADLRVVTALCDNAFNLRALYLLRLRLTGDVVSEASRRGAVQAVLSGSNDDLDHPTILRQLSGWPEDWRTQLAVALDMPAAAITKVGVGGPLVASTLMGLSIKGVLPYFEQAIRE